MWSTYYKRSVTIFSLYVYDKMIDGNFIEYKTRTYNEKKKQYRFIRRNKNFSRETSYEKHSRKVHRIKNYT